MLCGKYTYSIQKKQIGIIPESPMISPGGWSDTIRAGEDTPNEVFPGKLCTLRALRINQMPYIVNTKSRIEKAGIILNPY